MELGGGLGLASNMCGDYRSFASVESYTRSCGKNSPFRRVTVANAFRHCGQAMAFLSCFVLGVPHVYGADYTFTKIADLSGPFSQVARPAINDAGAVAFHATLDTGVEGIFIGTGGGANISDYLTVSDTSGPLKGHGEPTLDNIGRVAFLGTLDAGQQGIFASNGTTRATIAVADGNPIVSFTGNVSPRDDGFVGFGAHLVDGKHAVLIGNGAMPETIVDSTGVFNFLLGPVLNSNGSAAFWATLDAGGEGIFRYDGATTVTIASDPGPLGVFYQRFSMNDSGMVAFWANLDAGGKAVFTANGITMAPIADTSSVFSGFFDLSINNSGLVAFQAQTTTGVGIFTGPDPVGDKVIRVGDSLLGSTVQSLTLQLDGLNNKGQIAFWVRLADGTEGIFRADPETSPDLVDTDGDALPDDWETLGVDTNGDGERDLDLQNGTLFGQGLAASKTVPDIFVRVDWLEKTTVAAHSHKPTDETIQLAKEAFAREGINLHVILGQGIEETSELEVLLRIIDFSGDVYHLDSSDFAALRTQYLEELGTRPGMGNVFHYAIFGHYMDEMSPRCPLSGEPSRPIGLALSGTSDFIVAMQPMRDKGRWTSLFEASVFMHELGHTLGLGHGGISASGAPDEDNYKPNHLSIMNYAFVEAGLILNGKPGFLDYSRFSPDQIPNLMEDGGLNESRGLEGDDVISSYGTKWFCGKDDPRGRLTADANKVIDWDCDDVVNETGVKANINQDTNLVFPLCFERHTDLQTRNEWNNLDFGHGTIGAPTTSPQSYPQSIVLDEPELPAEEVVDVVQLRVDVPIDIRPGSAKNRIHSKSHGKIPVAILSTAEFDVTGELDMASLTFGRTGSEKSLAFCLRARRVNRDKLLDRVCYFNTWATGLQPGDAVGVLRGNTVDEIPVLGIDSVSVVK